MILIDRTAETATILETQDGRYIHSGGNPHARRSVDRINAVILHHTTFASPNLSRFDRIIANYVVLQDGRVLRLRDESVALNSIGSNHRGIDVEFEGLYPAAASAPPPAAQICAGRELVVHLRSRFRLTRIYAHAQLTPKLCPGPHIWYNVGLWGVRNGLQTSPLPHQYASTWTDPSLAVATPGIVDPWTGIATPELANPWDR